MTPEANLPRPDELPSPGRRRILKTFVAGVVVAVAGPLDSWRDRNLISTRLQQVVPRPSENARAFANDVHVMEPESKLNDLEKVREALEISVQEKNFQAKVDERYKMEHPNGEWIDGILKVSGFAMMITALKWLDDESERRHRNDE